MFFWKKSDQFLVNLTNLLNMQKVTVEFDQLKTQLSTGFVGNLNDAYSVCLKKTLTDECEPLKAFYSYTY